MRKQRNSRRQSETVDVSLERGQVTALVAGSVLALGVVFLLGVGFGKRLSAEPETHHVSPVAEATAKPAATTAPAAPALTFHDALTEKRVGETSPARHAAPAHHAAPATRTHAAQAANAVAKTAEAAAVVAKQVLADAAPAKPAPAAKPAAKPTTDVPAATDAARYSIQVASSKDASDTQRLAGKLTAAGYDARVVAADIPGRGRWYRVRVGHFATRQAAAHQQAGLKVALDLAGIVVAD